MAASIRSIIHLECQTCRTATFPEGGTRGVSRYTTTKNKKTTPGRLTLKKYCRYERKHTEHKETK